MDEKSSHHMQDNSRSEEYQMHGGMDPAQEGDPKMVYLYTCKACRMVIARTEIPMEPEGIENKMRKHKCPSPGKQDFEMELR